MKYDENKVKREVRKAFRMLAEDQGVRIGKNDFPYVRVDDEHGTSYFDESNKEIVIHPNHIGHGHSYFEEAGHALRNLVEEKRRLNPLVSYKDREVHEFIGRASETMGRDLTKGTNLEYLFKGEEPRNMKDRETRKKLIKKVQRLRKLGSEIREKEKQYKSSGHKKEFESNLDSLGSLIKDYRAGKIDPKELEKEFNTLGHQYNSIVKGLIERGSKITQLDMLTIKQIGTDYNFVGTTLRNYNESSGEEREGDLEDDLKFIEDHLKEERFIDIDPLLGPKVFLDMEKHQHIVHRRPYEYAEQYSTDELGNVFKMSDRAIRKKFFRREASERLEKVVGLIIMIAGGLAISTISITGAVIGAPFEYESIIGLILFIIGLYIFFLEK